MAEHDRSESRKHAVLLVYAIVFIFSIPLVPWFLDLEGRDAKIAVFIAAGSIYLVGATIAKIYDVRQSRKNR